MNQVHKNPASVNNINQTTLTLIPKCEDLSSGCGPSHYATLSISTDKDHSQHNKKYIVVCGGAFMENISQGRTSVDNYIILQELVHSFTNLKGAKGYMILKLDFGLSKGIWSNGMVFP